MEDASAEILLVEDKPAHGQLTSRVFALQRRSLVFEFLFTSKAEGASLGLSKALGRHAVLERRTRRNLVRRHPPEGAKSSSRGRQPTGRGIQEFRQPRRGDVTASCSPDIVQNDSSFNYCINNRSEIIIS